jgi:hypothetical protein
MELDYCHPPIGAEWYEREPSWGEALGTPKRAVRELEEALGRIRQAEPTTESIGEKFKEHADKWERETAHLSSPNQMMMHPSYQAILGMGDKVVPLLLRDLQNKRRPWFWALSYLTTENPINPSDAGKMDKMIAAWVRWGKAKGLL